MKTKHIIFALLGIILIFAIYKVVSVKPNTENIVDTQTNIQNNEEITPPSADTNQDQNVSNEYTLDEIAKHNSGDSCWTTINDNVYDVTSFVSKHPGGSMNILKICGKDGTSAFEQKHSDQKRPNETLDGFKIGTLKA